MGEEGIGGEVGFVHGSFTAIEVKDIVLGVAGGQQPR